MNLHKSLMVGVLAFVAFGCGKKGGATCEEAIAHMATFADQKVSAEDTAAAVADCKAKAPPEMVECLVAAKSKDDAVACLSKGAPGDPTKRAASAKATEAIVNVKKIYDGARTYYEEELPVRARTGGGVVMAFPTSVGPTPPLGACCKNDKHRCEPDPSLWAVPSWQALMFTMDDPSRYSYQFTSSGTGPDATFKVQAFGDLDCNGVYSTFELSGKAGSDGNVTQVGDMKKVNETE